MSDKCIVEIIIKLMKEINWKWIFKIVGIVGLIVLLLIGSLYLFYFKRFRTLTQKKLEKLPGGLDIEILKKIKVPEKGEKAEEGIAVPKETAPSAPKAESDLRIFDIKGEKGELNPKRIIVYQNDIVNIKFSALDRDYDFSLPFYGIQSKAKKGETKTIEFQATSIGKFDFYCSLCKTKEKPAGDLFVVPRE